MKILIKVLEHEFIDTVLTQEVIDSEVSIEESIKDFAIASFTMPLIPIQEDNIVEIYEVQNTDKKIFRGYVYKIEPIWRQFGFVKIECRSEKAIMTKRLALKSKASYNAINVTSLPVRPASINEGVNYWVNQSLTKLSFYIGTVIPKPPKIGPTPNPYYEYGHISFNGTIWITTTDDGQVHRIEDGQLLDEGTGTGVDINWLLDDLIDDYSNLYNENWTYETDFSANTSLDIRKGDTYFDILDELADQHGANRTIKDKVIIFKKILGLDKTSGSNYQEILYNGLYPNTANIKNISVIGTATRSNIIFAQDKSGNVMKDDSGYIDRIYGVAKKEFRDGELYSNLQKFLTDSNQSQRIYEVDVEQNAIDADVGDIIKLIVENTNSYFDIDSSVIVLSKTIIYTNGSKNISYRIGQLNIQVMNTENWLYGIQKDIKLLKVG